MGTRKVRVKPPHLQNLSWEIISILKLMAYYIKKIDLWDKQKKAKKKEQNAAEAEAKAKSKPATDSEEDKKKIEEAKKFKEKLINIVGENESLKQKLKKIDDKLLDQKDYRDKIEEEFKKAREEEQERIRKEELRLKKEKEEAELKRVKDEERRKKLEEEITRKRKEKDGEEIQKQRRKTRELEDELKKMNVIDVEDVGKDQDKMEDKIGNIKDDKLGNEEVKPSRSKEDQDEAEARRRAIEEEKRLLHKQIEEEERKRAEELQRLEREKKELERRQREREAQQIKEMEELRVRLEEEKERMKQNEEERARMKQEAIEKEREREEQLKKEKEKMVLEKQKLEEEKLKLERERLEFMKREFEGFDEETDRRLLKEWQEIEEAKKKLEDERKLLLSDLNKHREKRLKDEEERLAKERELLKIQKENARIEAEEQKHLMEMQDEKDKLEREKMKLKEERIKAEKEAKELHLKNAEARMKTIIEVEKLKLEDERKKKEEAELMRQQELEQSQKEEEEAKAQLEEEKKRLENENRRAELKRRKEEIAREKQRVLDEQERVSQQLQKESEELSRLEEEKKEMEELEKQMKELEDARSQLNDKRSQLEKIRSLKISSSTVDMKEKDSIFGNSMKGGHTSQPEKAEKARSTAAHDKQLSNKGQGGRTQSPSHARLQSASVTRNASFDSERKGDMKKGQRRNSTRKVDSEQIIPEPSLKAPSEKKSKKDMPNLPRPSPSVPRKDTSSTPKNSPGGAEAQDKQRERRQSQQIVQLKYPEEDENKTDEAKIRSDSRVRKFEDTFCSEVEDEDKTIINIKDTIDSSLPHSEGKDDTPTKYQSNLIPTMTEIKEKDDESCDKGPERYHSAQPTANNYDTNSSTGTQKPPTSATQVPLKILTEYLRRKYSNPKIFRKISDRKLVLILKTVAEYCRRLAARHQPERNALDDTIVKKENSQAGSEIGNETKRGENSSRRDDFDNQKDKKIKEEVGQKNIKNKKKIDKDSSGKEEEIGKMDFKRKNSGNFESEVGIDDCDNDDGKSANSSNTEIKTARGNTEKANLEDKKPEEKDDMDNGQILPAGDSCNQEEEPVRQSNSKTGTRKDKSDKQDEEDKKKNERIRRLESFNNDLMPSKGKLEENRNARKSSKSKTKSPEIFLEILGKFLGKMIKKRKISKIKKSIKMYLNIAAEYIYTIGREILSREQKEDRQEKLKERLRMREQFLKTDNYFGKNKGGRDQSKEESKKGRESPFSSLFKSKKRHQVPPIDYQSSSYYNDKSLRYDSNSNWGKSKGYITRSPEFVQPTVHESTIVDKSDFASESLGREGDHSRFRADHDNSLRRFYKTIDDQNLTVIKDEDPNIRYIDIQDEFNEERGGRRKKSADVWEEIDRFQKKIESMDKSDTQLLVERTIPATKNTERTLFRPVSSLNYSYEPSSYSRSDTVLSNESRFDQNYDKGFDGKEERRSFKKMSLGQEIKLLNYGDDLVPKLNFNKNRSSSNSPQRKNLGKYQSVSDVDSHNVVRKYFDNQNYPVVSMCFSPKYKILNLITENTETRTSRYFLLQLSTVDNILLNKLEIREIGHDCDILDSREDNDERLYILTSKNSLFVYSLKLILDKTDAKYQTVINREQNLNETFNVKANRGMNFEFPLEPEYRPLTNRGRNSEIMDKVRLIEAFRSGSDKSEQAGWEMKGKRLFFDKTRNRIMWWRSLQELVEVHCKDVKRGPRLVMRFTIRDKIMVSYGKNQMWLDYSMENNLVAALVYQKKIQKNVVFTLDLGSHSGSRVYRNIEHFTSIEPHAFAYNQDMLVISGVGVRNISGRDRSELLMFNLTKSRLSFFSRKSTKIQDTPLSVISRSKALINSTPIYKKIIIRGKKKNLKIFAFTQNSLDVLMIGFREGTRKLETIKSVMGGVNSDYLVVDSEGNQLACLGLEDRSVTLINGDNIFNKEYESAVDYEKGLVTRKKISRMRNRDFDILTGKYYY